MEILIVILGAILSFCFGALGYLVATFIVQPYLKYRELKSIIISDLVYFSNIYDVDIEDTIKNKLLFEKFSERIAANRRHASNLTAIHVHLPKIFLKYLYSKNEYPSKAALAMMKLSNSTNKEHIDKSIQEVIHNLRLDYKLIKW